VPSDRPNHGLDEAQTATCSDNLAFTLLAHKPSDTPLKTPVNMIPLHFKSVCASDPDLALIKFNYEERIKNAL